jgi:SAM-dependent methyltransferase
VTRKNYFDAPVARVYDTVWAEQFEPEFVDPSVRFLAELARDGAALELGIGTGRLALPLSARGVPVHGIELSPEMIEQFRAKPGADAYLVRNTIMNLTTQDEQVECFRNAAAHLEPGGCFVVEVIVPPLQRLPPGETFQAFTVTPTHLGFDEIDVVTQRSTSFHYWVDGERMQTFSAPFRYVWPSELDLMARLAGMRLRERWADWQRSPFTAASREHVSVWQKPA